MNFRLQFINWYNNVFKLDPLYLTMINTVENSKWHRETNVAIHTDMVVSQYISSISPQWSDDDLIGAFVTAFHDVGKPASEREFTNDDGSIKRKYSGHELRSARLWEDWAVRNWKFLTIDFEFTTTTLFAVTYMIEHHMPWKITKTNKLAAIINTVHHFCYLDTYEKALRADQEGRIKDVNDLENIENWLKKFRDISTPSPTIDMEAPCLFVLIGASGSGKSSFVNNFHNNNLLCNSSEIEVFSLDALRHDWYSADDYAEAFEKSCADSKFMFKAMAQFNTLIKNGKNVIVDNVNVSQKSRNKYTTIANSHGYNTIAVVFPIDIQTVIDRQQTRTDKTVPTNAVVGQYFNIAMPNLLDFNTIQVVDSNINT